MIGRTLAHYRVVAHLGAGGMGEVYRATDTKLGRDVALKILPDKFSADDDRIARFRREAQLLASLNHPNIAAIYGVEEDQQIRALVLELVEGPTLEEHLRRGPLPVREAIAIARKIADALEAAHDRGVIHRDLKPANVKLTPDGGVKVLDFGIAKALSDDDLGGLADEGMTKLQGLTRWGMMMGTPAYMSPEQARGTRVDQRVDIWAFGCLLFEMLTGRPVFSGSTLSDVQAATLRDEPPWEALPATVPPSVQSMLRRCLQKDPKQRFRDVADARFALEDATDLSGAVPVARPAAGMRTRGGWVVVAVAAIVSALAAAVATHFAWSASTVGRVDAARFTLRFASLDIPSSGTGPFLAVAPDGRHVAFLASSGGPLQVYLRRLDSLTPVALAGTEGAIRPFFAPDGESLGFFVDRQIKKVSVGGGAPVVIANLPEGRGGHWGASWGPDGTIIVGSADAKLLRVNANGGAVDSLADDKSSAEVLHRWPEVLPGGKAVLYVSVLGGQHDIVALSMESGRRTILIRGGTQPRYVSSGHIVYAQQVSTDTANLFSGALFAVPFDPNRLEVTGEARPVQEGVLVQAGGAANFGVSQAGMLVYMPGDAFERRRLVWMDRQGRGRPLADSPRVYRTPRVSPDGKRIVVTDLATNRGIWLLDIPLGTWNHLPMKPGEDATPIWSPDSKRIAYTSDEQGKSWIAAIETARSSQPLATPPVHQHLTSWSPDGRTIAFDVIDPETGLDIWTVPADGGPAAPFIKTPFGESQATFSPAGSWIAYQSNASGRPEVYIRPFPGPGAPLKVSPNGGSNPVWTKHGRELCFRQGMSVLAVDVASTPTLSVSAPTLLFRGRMTPDFDAAPDGSGFAMLVPAEEQVREQELVVLLDWFSELRQRMKGAK